jgi:hypothetical protein
MLAEFALEPTLLHNWDRFQRFVSLFGVGQGRLISRYPRKWQEMVLASVLCGPVEKLRITEALVRAAKSVLLSREHDWNPAVPWLENAVAEHAKRPFDALLAGSNPASHRDVVDASDLDVTALPAKLHAGPSRLVVRSAAQMAAAVRVLLQFSKKVVLIDRHFSPDSPRFRDPLAEMLMCFLDRHGRPRQVEVELHVGHRILDDAPDFRAACEAHLQDVIPLGMRLTIARWNHEELHNRYILTDRGGLSIGEGLDEANPKSSRTDDVLTLLSPETAAELMERFCGAAGLAKQLPRHSITGRKVTQTERG